MSHEHLTTEQITILNDWSLHDPALKKGHFTADLFMGNILNAALTGSTTEIGDLEDVIIASPTVNQVLSFDGTNWTNDNEIGNVFTSDTLTANTLVVGDGTNTVIAQDQMTVNGGGDELRIDTVTSGVGTFVVRDDVGAAKISMSYNDSSDIANIAFADAGNPVIQWLGSTQSLSMTHKNAVDDLAIFQTWERQGGTNPVAINLYITDDDPVGKTFTGDTFGDHVFATGGAIGLHVLRGGVWYPYITEETGVETADVLTANTMVIGAGTQDIAVADLITINGAGDSLLIDSADGTGTPSVIIRDSSDAIAISVQLTESTGDHRLSFGTIAGQKSIVFNDTDDLRFWRAGTGNDTDAYINFLNGITNGGNTNLFSTTRDPLSTITGNPGDWAWRDNLADSSFYIHRGSSADNTSWVEIEPPVTNFRSPTELTLDVSGIITITGSFHSVDTLSDAAADDLDTINGGVAGDIVVLVPENDARTINVTNAGNIIGAAFALDNTGDAITLIFDGTNWTIISSQTG